MMTQSTATAVFLRFLVCVCACVCVRYYLIPQFSKLPSPMRQSTSEPSVPKVNGLVLIAATARHTPVPSLPSKNLENGELRDGCMRRNRNSVSSEIKKGLLMK